MTEWVMKGNLIVPYRYRRPICIDLFAGCGGFSLGFIQAGFDIVAANDNEIWSTITYMSNLGAYPCKFHFVDDEDEEGLEKALKKCAKNESYGGEFRSGSAWLSHQDEFDGVGHFWLGDIRKIKGKDMLDVLGMEEGEVDCIIGGPPCQGYSTVGKRDVMDPRNSLVFEFIRMILEIQPKTFVFENVPGIVSMITPEGLPVIDAMCLMLEKGGYGSLKSLKKALLYSAGCGAAFKSKPGRVKNEKVKDSKYSQQSFFKFE